MLSFVQWLDRQASRGDAVGELAANRLWDADAPEAITVANVRRRMRAVRASRAFHVALAQAAAEYRVSVPSNVVPFTRPN